MPALHLGLDNSSKILMSWVVFIDMAYLPLHFKKKTNFSSVFCVILPLRSGNTLDCSITYIYTCTCTVPVRMTSLYITKITQA